MPLSSDHLTAHRLRIGATLLVGLALLLATLVAGLGAVSFQRQLESFQPLGFEAEVQGGGFRVTGVSRPEIGLRSGDLIFPAAGESLPGDSLSDLRHRLASQPESRLLVGRGDGLESVTYLRPPAEVDVAYVILAAIGLLYLMIGLYTALKDQHVPARLFYLWCLAFAAFFILSPILPPRDLADRLIYHGNQVTRTLLPFLTLHLFLVFPTRLLPRFERFLPALYLPAVLFLGFHFDLFGAATAATLKRLQEVELYLLVASSLVAALLLALRFARRPAWEQRRQVQWILFGMLGGWAPFLLLYVTPRALSIPWPAWTTAVAVLPLALVPLAFAWAILKYKLLDFAIILRGTATYALTGLVGLFGFALLHFAIRSGLADQLPLSRNVLTFLAGLAVAGVLAPTRSAVASGLARLQYRGSLGPRQLLNDLGHELLHQRDLDRLCAVLTEHLADGLVVRAHLYLAQGGAMVPVDAAQDLPRKLAFDAFGEGFWERDVSAVSAVQLPAEEATAEQRLFRQGLRYAFPLTVREHRIGVALVSYKYDEEPLNSEDLDLARGLLNQAALAIENAQLLEEVHRKLREVIRLEEYSNGILESSPAGIAVLDRGGRVLSANHAFAAIAGVPRPETVGRELETLLPLRPLPEPGQGPVEVSFCELSGDERYLQLSVAHHQQGEDRRILIVQDVSERIQMEAQLQEKERLASLGMLAAGVAHEVNTPLTGISSYAQMLLSDAAEDDPHYEILKKMERQTFRAAEIVNNLLEFTRNRSSTPGAVDLGAILGECVHLLEDRAAAAGVEIDWRPPSEPMQVSGHEGELHQVFTNLIVNAIDAFGTTEPAGDRRVTLTMEAHAGRVRTRVADNGPGIAPERLSTIFRPFFSSKISKGGSGLGLAITYNIVRRHGGEIRADNNRDRRGCTFTVELPSHGPMP